MAIGTALQYLSASLTSVVKLETICVNTLSRKIQHIGQRLNETSEAARHKIDVNVAIDEFCHKSPKIREGGQFLNISIYGSKLRYIIYKAFSAYFIYGVSFGGWASTNESIICRCHAVVAY